MNTATAAEMVGISYRRQLDFWITRGYLRPAIPSPGSGHARSLNGSEVEVLRWLARLVRAGIKAGAAAPIARAFVSGNLPRLGEFVLVHAPGEVETL